ncbi:nif11-like leader peptide domain protein [Synechococcus sp. BIOS-E4-1]|uniref:Nif11-like leader peptide family natural product precursor n=1 Tax=Synechococcus sp. BIOS-E4-1 TaxID=1400864 RepID=UPI0016475E52|nr:Nif11-like leader peptide family natural product precursor [Synechococcus sp. BIOS-E4-1]QNI53854.1 nif11-like leader peptide domain protein [Synechococcus sp. BIOS-E4-1]
MSDEQLKAFLEKVKSDTCLQEKLRAADDYDAVVAVAKAAGFSITTGDLKEHHQAQPDPSNRELESAAGGNHPNTYPLSGPCDCGCGGYPSY